MSYRSDVKLVTTKAGWERLEQAVGKVRSDDEYEYWVTTEGESERPCEGKYVLAEWDNIPWYDWEGDVAALMTELRQFDKLGIPYEFVRAGEEYGDVEQLTNRGNAHDMPSLWVAQEIRVSY